MLTLHAWDFVSENRFGNMPRARDPSPSGLPYGEPRMRLCIAQASLALRSAFTRFYHPKTKKFFFLSRARARLMMMIFIFLFI